MATTLPLARDGEGAREPDGALERKLAVRLRAGDRDAFEQLYESYRSRIYNLALRLLQSREDARDITQEVFIKAYRRLPGDGEDLRITPWLYRVAVNACYDHLRTRRRHGDLDEVQGMAGAATVDGFEQAELSRQLEQTLARLSERHRTVLLLKDVHGLRHDEIAGILGVSRGATETLLFRAREAFRRQYEDLARARPAAACELARRATVAAVGGGLVADERRRLAEHAQYCPECRKTVQQWGVAAVGLGALLPSAPLPAALQAAPPFGAAASAGGAGAGAAAASAGGAGLAGGAGGAGATVGGVIAHIAGAAAVKVAVVAVAATCTVSAAGVAAYRTATAGPEPDAPAAAKATGGGAGGAAAAAATDARKTPRGNAYGPSGKQKPNKDAKKQSTREKTNNGKATGRTGEKNAKEKAEKPARPAKPDQAKAPAKPEKPSAPEKPAKPEQAKAPAKPEKPAKPATPSPAGQPERAVSLQLA